MKLNDLLQEAKQVGTLYKYLSFKRAINALNSNELKGSKEAGGISLTRNSEYWRHSLYAGKDVDGKPTHSVQSSGLDNLLSVGFELDGDKISENYKIKPTVDPEARATTPSNPRFEAEEKIDSMSLKNLKKYLKRIRVIVPINFGPSKEELEGLKKAAGNIPIKIIEKSMQSPLSGRDK